VNRLLLVLATAVSCAGSKASTARQPLAGDVSILDFGARGAGNDDRTAIQAALNAGAGGTVHVPAGRWFVSRAGSAYFALTIPAGTTLVGESRDSSVLLPLGNTAPSVRVLEVDAPGVTIQSLGVDGSAIAADGNHQRHCVFARGPGLALRDVRLTGCSGDGLYLYPGADGATLDRVVSERNGRNGATVNASGTTVTASMFRLNAAQQFDSEPGSPGHVDNVRITGSTFDAMGASADYVLTICGSAGGQSANWFAHGNTINGGTYIAWASDIELSRNAGLNPTAKSSVSVYRTAERVRIADNTFAVPAAEYNIAITGTGTGQAATDVTVTGNRLSGGKYGIGVSGAVSVTIADNVLTGRDGVAAIAVRATNPLVPFATATLRHNTATGHDRGLSVAGMVGSTPTLTLLVASDNALGGSMYLDEGSGALQRAELTNNTPATVARWPAGAVLGNDGATVVMTRSP
jgi:hypothetical protein